MSEKRSPGDTASDDSADRVAQLARRVIAANARLNAIALVTAAGLIVLGVWVHSGITGSLNEVRVAWLQTMLDTNLKALQLWVEHKKTEVERLARDEQVREPVVRLTEIARREGAAGITTTATPQHAVLIERLGEEMKEAGAIGFNVIDASGLILATQFREYLGRSISPGGFLVHLREVFKGASRFIRPYRESERVEGATEFAFPQPVIWFEAPVRDARGEIIAALGFGHDAAGEFVNILNTSQPGRTGEAYVFDEGGLMLSESRFVADLRRIGLVPQEAGAGAMHRVQIRDPGGNLAAGHRPALELAARPLTQLAALAIAARGKTAVDERRGVILEPYRNYRGVSVVGGWKWLAEYDMGVGIEIGADEVYAPLAYLNFAFTVILSLVLAAIGVVLWSTVYVKRLQREVGESRFVGQYRIEKQIGEGGMGKVYLARHGLLKRPTALKMLKPHLASDEIVARFEREVQLASQLVHPNTIEIYDYGRTPDGVFYYVMEYLEGETLDRLVALHGPMPVGRTIHVLRQTCAALREAHGRGLVHRDIKPHNIMLCHRGGEHDVVKILDFGLVKDTEGRQSRDITQFQKFLGTPLYMSPERIRNPGDADTRADIYSVGAVGFNLLTARELFESGSDHDLTYHVLHTPPRRASEFATGIPRRLDDLILRCVAKDRSERPHDIVVVMALLEALAVEHSWTQRDAEMWWRQHQAGAGTGASPAASGRDARGAA